MVREIVAPAGVRLVTVGEAAAAASAGPHLPLLPLDLDPLARSDRLFQQMDQVVGGPAVPEQLDRRLIDEIVAILLRVSSKVSSRYWSSVSVMLPRSSFVPLI
jgi:hypothetical protein